MIFKSIDKKLAEIGYVKTVNLIEEAIIFEKYIYYTKDKYIIKRISVKPIFPLMTFDIITNINNFKESDKLKYGFSFKEIKLFNKFLKESWKRIWRTDKILFLRR